MAARVLAFVAAIAMVFGAIAIRGAIRDNRNGAGGGGGSSRLSLVCATELRTVCDELDAADANLDVTVEPASVTASRITSTDPKIDGWLTPGPWAEMIDAGRGAASVPLFAKAGPPLARSPLALAVWKTGRAALGCANPVEFGCLGDAVRTRNFRLGAAADTEAEAVLGDAALAAGHVKNADFATNDITETDLADWLSVLDASTDRVSRNTGGGSFRELLVAGPAAADAYLAPESVIGPQLARAARRGQLDLVFPTPVATIDVIFSPRVGDRGKRLSGIVRSARVRDVLRAGGWRTNATGSPRLPAGDGLPSAGVLQALRDVTK